MFKTFLSACFEEVLVIKHTHTRTQCNSLMTLFEMTSTTQCSCRSINTQCCHTDQLMRYRGFIFIYSIALFPPVSLSWTTDSCLGRVELDCSHPLKKLLAQTVLCIKHYKFLRNLPLVYYAQFGHRRNTRLLKCHILPQTLNYPLK